MCVCLSVCLRLSLPMAKRQYITAVMKYIAHLKKEKNNASVAELFAVKAQCLFCPLLWARDSEDTAA